MIYRAFGLTINSEIQCPELPSTDGVPDIHIRLGVVPDALENPKSEGVLFQAKPNHFILGLEDVARFSVKDGKVITVHPASNVEEHEIRLFLFGSVFGALLHQRGRLVLHAGAIETGKGAVAFVGHSGNGKSTIVGELIDRGYNIMADDVSSITKNEDRVPIVHPSFPQVKLWADALKRAGKDPSNFRQIRPGVDKYAVPVPENFAKQPLPIYKVFLLKTHNKPELEIESIEGMHKFRVILNNTYRMLFVDGLGTRLPHFQLASAVSNAVELISITRPMGSRVLDEIVDFIEENL